MKICFAVALCFAGLTYPSSVYALDCFKASSPVDKLICSTPELKRTDEAMSVSYFKLLRETTDPDFHQALIRSQRRWLEIRSRGPDRFGQAQSDATDDREILLKMTRERLAALQTSKPIHMLELQRKIASEDGGGKFAGYRTYCVLQPPPYGNWGYECWGDTLRQHNDRICSSVEEWSSGHMTEYRAVSILKSDEPKAVATCSTGYNTTDDLCPESGADVGGTLDAHWNTRPGPSEPLPTSHIAEFRKFDADIDPSPTDREWMHECLFTSTYPPLEMSAPTSKN